MKDLLATARETRYPVAAFEFVRRGLDHTVRQIHGDPHDDETTDRHVSGEQLCHGLREFALAEYGLLARTVLKHWKIHSSSDFGRIVFAMIEAGQMQKTDRDSLEDFYGIFDFDTAFTGTLMLTEQRSSE